jgi:hypothetical protein
VVERQTVLHQACDQIGRVTDPDAHELPRRAQHDHRQSPSAGIVCLQELKAPDEKFPAAARRSAA